MKEPDAGDFLIAMRAYVSEVIEDSWRGVGSEDKEDLVQDTIRNAWTHWQSFEHKDEALRNSTVEYVDGRRVTVAKPGKAACGWLASIAKNVLYDLQRKNMVAKKFEDELEILYTCNSDSPEEIITAEQILGDTPVLTKKQQVIRDVHILGNGGSLEDIAREYNCSVGTLRNESKKVKEIMKRALKGELDVSRY